MTTPEPDQRAERAILLLSCQDARGIVADISQFIFVNRGNILQSDQHRDGETATFFMRIEWDTAGFAIPKGEIAERLRPIAEKYEMNWRLAFSSRKAKMAILVSGVDHCLYELLIRNQSGEIQADIPLVIGNHKSVEPIARYFNIPFHYLSTETLSKTEVEEHQLHLLGENEVDLVVLARYMQILQPAFVAAYRHRIINIHHSFLPAFIGARPYHQAHSRGVKIIGATSHYVTEELDQGPIIEQDVARISHRDSVADLISKGKNLEKLVLSRAVRLHLDHKVLIFGNKTVVFD